MKVCTPLYQCHRWDCNTCAKKKLFWLREKAINFARIAKRSDFKAITLKGFNSADSAYRNAAHIIKSQRAKNPRYNAKLEYFFVVSKHGFSDWHIHLIINRFEGIDAAYCEPVESLKAICLYMIDNLAWSLRSDYGKVRRYGTSSLLNKQNMKRAYKTRIRLWSIRTRIIILAALQTAIINWLSTTTRPPAIHSDHPTTTTRPPDHPTTHKTRPPPPDHHPRNIGINLLILRSLSSKR